MYNVYEVVAFVHDIDGSFSTYQDFYFTCLVFCHYEDTAKYKTREKLMEEYNFLKNKAFCISYKITLKLKNVLKGGC